MADSQSDPRSDRKRPNNDTNMIPDEMLNMVLQILRMVAMLQMLHMGDTLVENKIRRGLVPRSV